MDDHLASLKNLIAHHIGRRSFDRLNNHFQQIINEAIDETQYDGLCSEKHALLCYQTYIKKIYDRFKN